MKPSEFPELDERTKALLREYHRREQARTKLSEFVPFVTEGLLKPFPHHKIICDTLDEVLKGNKKRVVIAAPPAHAKSVYTSHNFPALWLGQNPTDKIIAASHTQPFAEDIGRTVRNLVQNPLYGQLFDGMGVSSESRAAARWHTTAGGSYFSTGVSGSVVGRRANLILVDDPYKSKQVAYSQAERKKISEWYFTDVVPRLLPNGAIVLIQTRWHEDDLAGEVLKKSERGEIEPFELISLTALCEDPETDPMGRDYGEALWPSQYSTAKLKEIRGGMEEDEWNALYQQRPRPAETGEISSKWFGEYTKLPDDEPYLRFTSWDTAGAANERADYTVGLAFAMGLKTRKFYILDMYREKVEFHNLMKAVPQFERLHESQATLIENKGTGSSLVSVLKYSGLNIIPIPPQKLGSKEYRFEQSVPAIESGRVYLPKAASWKAAFLDELLVFPGGVHDDIVDAFSQAINHYGSRGVTRRTQKLIGA